MWTYQSAILHKTPVPERLLAYGFLRQDGGYRFSAPVMDGTMELVVTVSDRGDTGLKVVDLAAMEDYTLLFVPTAVGSFVGEVRKQCEALFADIVSHCYESDWFQYAQTRAVIRHIRDTYGVEAEHLWEDTPDNAIFRDTASRKWFAVIQTPEKRKLGMPEDGRIEILNLKAPPEEVAALVDGVCYLPGYHMNKRHWYTVRLDGSVPIETLCDHIDRSFAAVVRKKKR